MGQGWGWDWEGVIEATRRPISRWDVHRWMLLTFVVFKRLCFSRKPIGWRALYQQPTRIRQRTGTATAVYRCFRRFHSQGRGSQAQRVKLHGVNVHARPSVRRPAIWLLSLSVIHLPRWSCQLGATRQLLSNPCAPSKLRCNTIGSTIGVMSAIQMSRCSNKTDAELNPILADWTVRWIDADACSE